MLLLYSIHINTASVFILRGEIFEIREENLEESSIELVIADTIEIEIWDSNYIFGTIIDIVNQINYRSAITTIFASSGISSNFPGLRETSASQPVPVSHPRTISLRSSPSADRCANDREL